MTIIVLTFLFLSVLFYLTFGGADFGVGVLEMFSRKSNRAITKRTAYKVIGPVWEANHMWLIICIVILWIAFPIYYNLIVTQLHIPISLLLVGIIGRGTAFVFRHYDAYEDRSQVLYDRIFQISSVITPMFIGIIAGALISGEMIHPDLLEGKGFKELYVSTWFNPFSLLVGVFVTSLNAFTSAVFISGETTGEEHVYYLKKAKKANIAIVISGALVLAEALISSRELLTILSENWYSFFIFLIASVLLFPLWKSLKSGKKLLPRLFVGIQLFMVLLGWCAFSFPHLIFLQEGKLSILERNPPEMVFTTLGYALIIASVVVLPGLYHLFKTFGLISK